MIDFPASPTDGQIFSAANGVVYKYSAAYTSWLAQNPTPPLGGTGDFFAYQSTGLPALPTVATTLIPSPVLAGNSGNWYNTSTGRFTPPAGRYYIYASYSGYHSSASATYYLQIRKNGSTTGPQVYASAGSANIYAEPVATLNVDANGTDWFDIQGYTSAISASGLVQVTFGAFPLTGMQGPTGGAPGPVVGDFAAMGTPGVSAGGTALAMPVINGNSGGYYNAATGRWTPPAGRYNLYGCLGAWNNSAGIGISVNIRKNGVVFGQTISTNSPGANVWGTVTIEAQVDANGTDYFEIFGSATATGSTGYMGAYPIQGMVGPQGPAGVISNGYRLISRVVPTANQNSVDFTNIPSDINDLELRWDVTGLSAAALIVQAYGSTGVVDGTSGRYIWTVIWSQHAMSGGSSPTVYNSTSQGLTTAFGVSAAYAGSHPSTTSGIRGHGTINGIRDTRVKSLEWQTDFLEQTNTYGISLVGTGMRNFADAVTGVRVTWGVANNFAAGGSVSLWGSP
jgi:hypothetical protein